MPSSKIRPLDRGYTSEIDVVHEAQWHQILPTFDDANIYQTWSYAEVICGSAKMSHLVLKKDGEIVALAQARIARLPFVKLGVAYIHWGPVWRRSGSELDSNAFRQAVRALRNEFVCRRGLVLRVFPPLVDDGLPQFLAILAEEGCSPVAQQGSGRTILIDLSSRLEDLRGGMNAHWQRELKAAEKRKLTVVQGSGDDLFEGFIGMYKEMVSRKKFLEPNDINQFRMIQSRLPEPLKMKIMLCSSSEGLCSGAICSAIGKTAMYLFGATSDVGVKSKGSYLLQWKLIEQLKSEGIAVYDLNGINPVANPGTYKFKNDLAGKHGKDVRYLGRFDSHGTSLSRFFVQGADLLRAKHRSLREAVRSGGGVSLFQIGLGRNGTNGGNGEPGASSGEIVEPVAAHGTAGKSQGAHRQ